MFREHGSQDRVGYVKSEISPIRADVNRRVSFAQRRTVIEDTFKKIAIMLPRDEFRAMATRL